MRKSQRTKCNEFRHAFTILTDAWDELGGAFERENLVENILQDFNWFLLVTAHVVILKEE